MVANARQNFEQPYGISYSDHLIKEEKINYKHHRLDEKRLLTTGTNDHTFSMTFLATSAPWFAGAYINIRDESGLHMFLMMPFPFSFGE